MTNDDEKRRKMDERKGSMKKAKDGKVSIYKFHSIQLPCIVFNGGMNCDYFFPLLKNNEIF